MKHTEAAITAALTNMFGLTKSGKTSAALGAYPGAMCIGVSDSLKLTWQNTLALPLDKLKVYQKPMRTLQQLEAMLAFLEANPDRKPGQIIIDDFGKLVETTYNQFDQSPDAMTATGKKNSFYAGQQTKPIIDRICEKARHLGIAVIVIMHEKPPGYDSEGNFRKGGPQTPWRSFGERVEEWFDINLRVTANADSLDPWGFHRSFYCAYGSEWHVGDRSEVCWDNTPGSLYEVLRAGGSRVERFPGLEWQDEIAENVAIALTARGAADKDEVKAMLTTEMPKWHVGGRNQKHLRWAVQDGIARYQIQSRQAQDIFDFGDSAESVNPADSGESGVTGNLPPK